MTTEFEPSADDITNIRAYLFEALHTFEDLGLCPYNRMNGKEGAYGPNTCFAGCREAPECQTGPWPSERLSEPVLEWALAFEEEP